MGVSYTRFRCYLPITDASLRRISGLLAFDANLSCTLLRTTSLQDKRLQGSEHLSLTYILEQLPVIVAEDYGQRFGGTTARELVRDHVLRLTYTAHDMAPFARDLGYDGPPFTWDEEERRHLRGRLDALYFHLYGLSRDDANYILSTFPIVRHEDKAQDRPLPHPRPHPRLHERPRRRRHRNGRLGVELRVRGGCASRLGGLDPGWAEALGADGASGRIRW